MGHGDNMKICCILAGAEIFDYAKLLPAKDRYIICADGGYMHAKEWGIVPDVVLGDFDSLCGELPTSCEVLRYSSEKDDTDTMLAVKLALERGFKQIEIYGATGGRLDHTLANIQALLYIKENNADGTLFGDTEQLTILKNEGRSFARQEGRYFSILALSERAEGVTERGMKYELTNASLTNSFPLGISNEITADFGWVEVKNGTLLIVFSQK